MTKLRLGATILATTLFSCSPTPEETSKAISTSPCRSFANPSCTLKKEGPRLLVNGNPSSQQIEPALDSLVVFGCDERSILFAGQSSYLHMVDISGSDTLWLLSCAEPHSKQPAFVRPGGDFGHAIAGEEGTRLYFTDSAGASVLSVTDFSVRPLTRRTPPALDDPDAGLCLPQRRDVVLGWDPYGGIRIARGEVCGVHSDWSGVTYIIPNPRDHEPGEPLQRLAPVTGLAVSAGILWVATGGRCSAPGHMDLFTPGLIWRSSDTARNWESVPVEGLENGVRELRVDPEGSGRMLVLAEPCRHEEDETEGCPSCGAFLSSDAGHSWIPLVLPEANTSQALQELRLVDHSQDLMELTLAAGYSEWVVWKSPDFGKTWQQVARGVGIAPAATAGDTIRLQGVSLVATDNGLWSISPKGEQLAFHAENYLDTLPEAP